jgi:hypothetical protein
VTNLPPALPGTEARILATTDLGANAVPLPTSYGTSGTLAGIVELLDRERERQPTLWLDVGDLVVGNPSHPLLGERPWADVADLPIAAAAAGNHEFDDGVDALLEAARCRMPAAASTGAGEPASVAMIPGVTRHLSLLLDRDVQAEPAGASARDALVAAVT